MKVSLTIITVMNLCFTTGINAHHSRANFDLETIVEVEGVVTEFAWKNPHSFTAMEVTNENGEKEEWLVEMQGTPLLIRLGWDKTSLKVGDKIVARGNPDRNPEKHFLYLDDIITETGVLWGEIPDAGFTPSTDVRKEGKPRPEALQRVMKQLQANKEGSITGTFEGTWLPAFGGAMNLHTEDSFFSAERNARLTPEGEAMMANYTDDDDPTYHCGAYGIPYINTMPFENRITRDVVEGQNVLRMDYAFMDLRRVIHMDKTEHPENIERSLLGHSIGRIEEDGTLLVIDTIGFSESKWGTARGIHQSEEKRIVEKFRLMDGGQRLEYLSYTFDPPYLAGPFVRALQYQNEKGRPLSSYPCDPDAATRHLNFEDR